ncbi:MAG: hypothetical protein P4L36_08415 [Holophaga sp.]|nr:hypothetical protein [Holophaga sp.]
MIVSILAVFGTTIVFAPGGFPGGRMHIWNRLPLVMMTGIFDAHCQTDDSNLQPETMTVQPFTGVRLTKATSHTTVMASPGRHTDSQG